MGGLKFKAPTGVLQNFFTVDDYGLFIPNLKALPLEEAKMKITRLLDSNTDYEFRLGERLFLTDVAGTHNPLGNSNAIGFGVKDYGPQVLNPRKLKYKGNFDTPRITRDEKRKLSSRQRKIELYQQELMKDLAAAKPEDTTSPEYALWEVESDQVMTGGGFDNNQVGDATLKVMEGLISNSEVPDIRNSDVSRAFVESCLELRAYLEKQGMERGSLEPDDLLQVRFEQDRDGMFGSPVFVKGEVPLNRDIATRLLIESGVDTRLFVSRRVRDSYTDSDKPYRVVDALGYILDNGNFTIADLIPIIVYLLRIQKHGWKEESGDLKAKDGKARGVFPASAIAACVEGMLINPFVNKIKELKVDRLAALQEKPVRDQLINSLYKRAADEDYDFLAADWSQYDSTVPGWGLATIMQLVVKPFFKAKFYDWVDTVTFIECFKIFILPNQLAQLHSEKFDQVRKFEKVAEIFNGKYTMVGVVGYLQSGLKFTFVGGSCYGLAGIHTTIPKLLGFEPKPFGQQAGDDTLLPVPRKYILSTKEETYKPFAEVSSRLGLKLNESKQIYYFYRGNLIGIFLQCAYCVIGDFNGMGSIYRYLSAINVSERNKGLLVCEQLMAEIARANNGFDNYFVEHGVEFWLKHEQILGVMFKEMGASKAFETLTDASGKSREELLDRVDISTYSYGISKEQFLSGDIPILPVMERVASKMRFELNLADAISALNSEAVGESSAQSTVEPEEEDD